MQVTRKLVFLICLHDALLQGTDAAAMSTVPGMLCSMVRGG